MLHPLKTLMPALMLLLVACSAAIAQAKDMIVRISEIEIHPNRLAEYNAILKEEAEASVRLEPGVIAIFPMSQKEKPTELRILEIYASREAYEAHLKTPHFQKYKATTLEMVKSLKLVDMDALDAQTMARILKKMHNGD
jgi:quinol monooxygenase YgiN